MRERLAYWAIDFISDCSALSMGKRRQIHILGDGRAGNTLARRRRRAIRAGRSVARQASAAQTAGGKGNKQSVTDAKQAEPADKRIARGKR